MDVSDVKIVDLPSAQTASNRKPGQKKPKPGRLEAREARAFWLLISPWIIGFIAFTGGPIIASLFLSFTDYTGTSQSANFIGLQNYQTLFTDPIFLKSISVTTYYVILALPTAIVCSLLLALLLHRAKFGTRVFRTIFYMPTVVSGVAVALLWEWILNPDFGLANYFLHFFHLPAILWFQDERTVIPAFVVMSLWSLGGPMVVFLAALQGVPPEMYEAASLDGANSWNKFWHITIPFLSPVILFNAVTGLIGTFQVFTPGYVISGGGPNYASMFYVLYLFNNAFQYFKFGYAAGQAWILFVIILALTILLLRLSKRFVYYES